MIGRQRYGVHPVDTVDSAGINVRYWLPPAESMGAGAPLVIYCHQLSGNEQIPRGYWAYPMIHAAIQQGCMVAASRAHGDNWGNAASLTDVVNEYNLMNAIKPVSKVVLVGASMGGLDAALTAAKKTLPTGKLKGVYLIDPVLDLNWAYTASPGGTANGFQSSINAAYGVTSFAEIPAGHSPLNSYDAANYAGLRWRIYASAADVTVSKAANAVPFHTKITGVATESAVVHHDTGGHTASAPVIDFAEFLGRCLA
ncbi:alpha/beta fold hydrolase [Kocuria salina]|uniref:alpha/beta fold hydrolase n=1 Tax=Kocuria salina TaxID=1929416 RepID=UPI0015943FAD|nr:alpha/beta fold hydrolase [Kocuria salina]